MNELQISHLKNVTDKCDKLNKEFAETIKYLNNVRKYLEGSESIGRDGKPYSLIGQMSVAIRYNRSDGVEVTPYEHNNMFRKLFSKMFRETFDEIEEYILSEIAEMRTKAEMEVKRAMINGLDLNVE